MMMYPNPTYDVRMAFSLPEWVIYYNMAFSILYKIKLCGFPKSWLFHDIFRNPEVRTIHIFL